MKSNFANLSRFSPLILIAVIGGIFAFYYLNYIPGRGYQIDQHNLRVLSMINKNMTSRYEALEKKLSVPPRLVAPRHHNSKGLKEKQFKEYTVFQYDASLFYEKEFKAARDKKAELDFKINNSSNKSNLGAGPTSMRGPVFFPFQKTSKSSASISQLKKEQEENNEIIAEFERKIKERKSQIPIDSLKSLGIPVVRDNNVYIIDVEETMSHLFRRDIFDKLLIIKFSKKESGEKKSKLVYEDGITGLFDNQFDTLANFSSTNGMNAITKAITGTFYRLYFEEIDLGGDSYVMCGLYPLDEYQSGKSSIPIFLLIFVIFVALFISLGLPTLKLSLSNQFERTTKVDVFTVSVTALLALGILTLFINFILYYSNHSVQTADEELDDVAVAIETKLNQEIDQVLRQMMSINSCLNQFSANNNGRRLKEKLGNAFEDHISGPAKATQFAIYSFNDGSTAYNANLELVNTADLVVKSCSLLDDIRDFGWKYKKDLPTFHEYGKKTARKDSMYQTYMDLEEKFSDLEREVTPKIDQNVLPEKLIVNVDSIRNTFAAINLAMNENKLFQHYPYFESYSLIHDYGQVLKWRTNDTPEPTMNLVTKLGDREYLKALYENRGWERTIDGKSVNYFFEPVFSKSTGKVSTEFSMRCPDIDVNKTAPDISVISTRLYSINDPILPKRFGFSILNENGEVMYHADSRFALQENFLDECSNQTSLKAALKTGGLHYGSTDYHTEGIQYLLKPIANTQYSLLVFSDLTYHNKTLLHSFSSSFILFLSIIALLLTLSYIQHVFLLPKYKFIQRGYFLDWLRPKGGPRFHKNCMLLFGIQASFTLIMFMVAMLTPFKVSLYVVYATFITPIVFFPYSYNLLGVQNFRQMPIRLKLRSLLPVALVLLVINYLIIFHFSHEGHASSLQVGIVLLVIQLAIAIYPLPFILNRGLQQWIYDKMYRLYHVFIKPQSRKNRLDRLKARYIPYYFCLTVWMVFISALPNIVFVKNYQEAESILFTVLQEIEISEKIKSKAAAISHDWRTKKPLRSVIEKQLYLDTHNSYQLEKFSYDLGRQAKKHSIDGHSASVISSLTAVRGVYGSYSGETDNLLNKGIPFSMQDDKVHYTDEEYVQNNKFLSPINVSAVSAYHPNFSLGIWIVAVVLMIGLLILIYHFIKFITSKLFAIDLVIGHELTEKVLRDRIDLRKSLILWSHNGSIPLGLRKDEPEAGMHTTDVELVDISAYLTDSKKLTDSLSKVISRTEANKRTTLIVPHHVEAITEYLRERIDEEDQKETSEQKIDWHTPLEKWQQIQHAMKELIIPIQDSVTDHGKTLVKVGELVDKIFPHEPDRSVHKKSLRDALSREFEQSAETMALLDQIEKRVDENTSYEEIISEVEYLAKPYYWQLWSTCTKKEKFALYDISKDGYINVKNKRTILKLCEKGLIICNGSLQVMNESFRNFVIKHIDPEMIKEMHRNVREKGRWAKLRAPIALGLIAIAAFVFITQEEVYTKSIAFITTLLTILPALLRFIPTSRVSAADVSK